MPPSIERLLFDLRSYAIGPGEKETRDRFLDLLRTRTDPFAHSNRDHVTASAVIARAGGRDVLLRYHRKLDRWLQPGGHVEPEDGSIFGTALREAREETGIEDFAAPFGDCVLDMDVHDIPPRFGAPGHSHYDVRFLLIAPEGAPASEQHRTRWFAFDEILRNADPSLSRAVRKARQWLDSAGRRRLQPRAQLPRT